MFAVIRAWLLLALRVRVRRERRGPGLVFGADADLDAAEAGALGRVPAMHADVAHHRVHQTVILDPDIDFVDDGGVSEFLQVDDRRGIGADAGNAGGGLLENIPRVLPDGLAAHLQKGSWPQTELFAWLQKTAGIDDIEMNRTFNNGIGMVVVIAADQAQACAATLRGLGETVYTIGRIAAQGDGAQVVVA